MDEAGHTSVVLHVDLDSFYAAVEHVRLGIPYTQPLAVQQWEGLIAVNYAARAAGIARHERMSEALRKLVHVETIGGNKPGTAESVGPHGNAKVSLERYRQASAKVFTIFRRYAKLCERASIDEAYLDVSEQREIRRDDGPTNSHLPNSLRRDPHLAQPLVDFLHYKVEEMLQKGCDWEGELQRLLQPAGTEGAAKEVPIMKVEGGPLVSFNLYDRRLLAGAILADRIRASVRNELGYTCSVGIATNKLLAKIASPKNKPDRQTLIPPRAVPGLMQDLPLKKIKLLGGKLGEEMKKKWGCSTAGEAQQISQIALVACFGERLGTYAWKAVRGMKAEKVQVNNLVKSMLAAKSFAATSDLTAVRRWLMVLSQELALRMQRDFEQNQRQPKLFQLYYRCGTFKSSADHSKSVAMPTTALQILSQSCGTDDNVDTRRPLQHEQGDAECGGDDTGLRSTVDDSVEGAVTEKTRALGKVLEDVAFRVFEQIEGAFPCTRLALAAGGFQELPGQGAQSIQHFFTSGAPQPVAADVDSERQYTAPSSSLQSPIEKPAEKAKGILKYLTPNTTASVTLGEQELNTTTSSRSTIPQSTTTSITDTNTEVRRRPGSVSVDAGRRQECSADVDIETVSIEEQRRILEGIHQAKHPSVQTKKVRGSGGEHRVSSNKRAREQTQLPHPKQPSIGAFFQSCQKP